MLSVVIILRLKPTALFVSIQVFEMVIRSLSAGYADTNSRATIKTQPDIRQACQVLMQRKLLAIQKPQIFVGLLAHKFFFKTSGNCFFLFTESARPSPKPLQSQNFPLRLLNKPLQFLSVSVTQLVTSSEITTKIEKRFEKQIAAAFCGETKAVPKT